MSDLVRAPVGAAPWLIRTARWLGSHPFPHLVGLTVAGADNVPAAGPALLVANHSAFLDGPVLFAAAPREGRFLVKSELYRGPLGHILGRLDQVPVNRGRADRTALHAALEGLRTGRLVGVFPEGTRGEGTVERIHDGVGWLLCKAEHTPVVPVAMFGTLRRHRRAHGGGIRVVFGAPVRILVGGDPSARSSMRDVARQVQGALAAHVLAHRPGAAADVEAAA